MNKNEVTKARSVQKGAESFRTISHYFKMKVKRKHTGAGLDFQIDNFDYFKKNSTWGKKNFLQEWLLYKSLNVTLGVTVSFSSV